MGLFCQIGTHFFPARKDSVLAISIIPYWYLILRVLSARLHGGGGWREVGEVIRLGRVTRLSLIWSPHLSCKRDQVKTGDYMDRRVTPPKKVSSPTWGPPPPCKQALNYAILARQYLVGFYIRDFTRQTSMKKDIKFRDSSVLNLILYFKRLDVFKISR